MERADAGVEKARADVSAEWENRMRREKVVIYNEAERIRAALSAVDGIKTVTRGNNFICTFGFLLPL